MKSSKVSLSKNKKAFPSAGEYALIGLGAGLWAGLFVALVETARLWFLSGAANWTVPGYAAAVYGIALGMAGAGAGLFLAMLGRLLAAPATTHAKLGSLIGGSLFFVVSLVVAFFYVQRDVFGEKAGFGDLRFLGAVLLCAVVLLVVTLVTTAVLSRLRGLGDWLCSFPIALGGYLIATVALLVAGLAIGEPSREAQPGPQPKAGLPNILLVMVDTLRADHVGVYGDSRGLTPNLDALARQGVIFSNAFAQSAWTRPSVATILTGRYPSSHTAVGKGSMLPDEVTTLAEALTDSGYESLGIVTNYNLTPFFKFDQGFHEYRYLSPDLPLWSNDTQSKLVFLEVWKKLAAKFAGSKERPQDYYVTGDIVSREALSQLDARDKNRPFFQFVVYMDPHDPYFRHPFDGFAISHRRTPKPDASLIPQMKELYAGEVRFWDEAFGEFVKGLEQRGLMDDTLLVVVSDHGEEFGEHGGFWHGTTLYDEQLRILFVAKFPSSAGIAGAVVPDWVKLVDVAPFILDAAGLPIPQEMQGSPRPTSAASPVFAEEDHQGNVLKSVRMMKEGAEVKLIQANPGNPRGLAEIELYRVDEDPMELKNLSDQQAELLAETQAELQKQAEAAKQGAAQAVHGDLSGEAKKILGNLGYMNDEED